MARSAEWDHAGEESIRERRGGASTGACVVVLFVSLAACSGGAIPGTALENGSAANVGGNAADGTTAGHDARSVAVRDEGTPSLSHTGVTNAPTPPADVGGAFDVDSVNASAVPTAAGGGGAPPGDAEDMSGTGATGGDTPRNETPALPVVTTLAGMVVAMPQLVVTLPVPGGFTEGPLWHPSGYLLFSERNEKAIWKWTPGSAARKVRSVGRKTNGLTFDAQGNLVACEDAESTVTRLAAGSGARTVVASTYQNTILNGPNDCIVGSDGAVYFTDPWYALGNRGSEIGAYGVYRVATDGSVTQISKDFANASEGGRGSPNGLGLSPDEATLYVANTGGNAILSFARGADGAYRTRSVFASLSTVPELRQPDGLKISAQGHVIVGVKEGVLFLNPNGSKLGFVRVRKDPAGPETGEAVGAVSNVAFGGPEFKSLFLTCNERLFRIELAVKGARPWNFTSAIPDPLPQ